MSKHHAKPFAVRDFDDPDATIAELARPVSAIEVSARLRAANLSVVGDPQYAGALNAAGDATSMLRRIKSNLAARKKWEAREARLRAQEVVQC